MVRQSLAPEAVDPDAPPMGGAVPARNQPDNQAQVHLVPPPAKKGNPKGERGDTVHQTFFTTENLSKEEVATYFEDNVMLGTMGTFKSGAWVKRSNDADALTRVKLYGLVLQNMLGTKQPGKKSAPRLEGPLIDWDYPSPLPGAIEEPTVSLFHDISRNYGIHIQKEGDQLQQRLKKKARRLELKNEVLRDHGFPPATSPDTARDKLGSKSLFTTNTYVGTWKTRKSI